MLRLRFSLACCGSGSVRWIFQSKAFASASKDLPSTPEGRNPYDVLEITVTNSTSLDNVAKQYRELVVRNHPDRPGGSHERMSEVNAAYKIAKEHHSQLIKRLAECEARMKGSDPSQTHRQARSKRDEELGRSGGILRKNAKADSRPRKARSLQEVESEWRSFKEETESVVVSMCNRYELAIEQGRFFRKTSMLNEITVRERWLRKTFIKSVWEDVHELRGEILRRGARSAQQSQLAEEMVSFASLTQRKLNEDFQRLTQMSVQSQSRLFVQRVLFTLMILVVLVKMWKWFFSTVFKNTFTVRFRQAILGY